LVTAEHVPDRLGESAGEVDLGDLGLERRKRPGFFRVDSMRRARGIASFGGVFRVPTVTFAAVVKPLGPLV
jgi:hypothetical protein